MPATMPTYVFCYGKIHEWYICTLNTPGDARATAAALRHGPSPDAAAPVHAHAGDHPLARRALHLGPALADGLRRLPRGPE